MDKQRPQQQAGALPTANQAVGSPTQHRRRHCCLHHQGRMSCDMQHAQQVQNMTDTHTRTHTHTQLYTSRTHETCDKVVTGCSCSAQVGKTHPAGVTCVHACCLARAKNPTTARHHNRGWPARATDTPVPAAAAAAAAAAALAACQTAAFPHLQLQQCRTAKTPSANEPQTARESRYCYCCCCHQHRAVLCCASFPHSSRRRHRHRRCRRCRRRRHACYC